MSRKQSQPPISLFSFQDIITSVTAIVIVIVMCLTLELMEKSTRSTESIDSVAVESLQAAVESLRIQLNELQSKTIADPSVVAEAASVTPNQVTNEIAELKRQLNDSAAKLALEQRRTDDLRYRSESVDAMRFDGKAELDELEQIEDRIRDAEVRLQKLSEIKRPIYVMPRGSNRDGWLVVIDSDSIEAAQIGVQAPPIKFQEPQNRLGFNDSLVSDFMKWVDGSNGSQLYLMIVVRPGGAEHFQDLEDALSTRSISYGYDVTSAGQQLLDATIGAGTP